MNYNESLKKKYKFERKANEAMSIYIAIADDLYYKTVSKYAGLQHINIDETGIEYEYYKDNWDYSAGRDTFHVSKEKLESLVEEYKRKERKNKLKVLKNEGDK